MVYTITSKDWVGYFTNTYTNFNEFIETINGHPVTTDSAYFVNSKDKDLYLVSEKAVMIPLPKGGDDTNSEKGGAGGPQ